jgi:hypothetical protein
MVMDLVRANPAMTYSNRNWQMAIGLAQEFERKPVGGIKRMKANEPMNR